VTAPEPASHVVGGTVYGSSPPSTVTTSRSTSSPLIPTAVPVIDVTEPLDRPPSDDAVTFASPAPGPAPLVVDIGGDEPTVVHSALPIDGEEMSARFGDRWVDGFEVCEAVSHGIEFRYRLRRRVDGSVLPKLFTAEEIRPAAAVAQERNLDRRGVWSRLSK
jgi:hypothetical protein